MKLDVTVLGTFYRMADEGAGVAAGRLSTMTDVETDVGVTTLDFVRGAEIRRDFETGTEKVGIRVALSGAIEGHSIVVFDREGAFRIVESLLETDAVDGLDEMARSATTEVGQIMTSGFVDGWADVLETRIDMSPPTFVAGETVGPFLESTDAVPETDDLVLVFRSRIGTADTAVEFTHYLFPDQEAMAGLLERLRTGEGIDYEKLDGFDRMAKRGAEEVAAATTSMTGIETDVEIRRLTFVALESIPHRVPNEMVVSVAFEFDGTPSGYLLFLFDEDSATEVVEAMVPDSVEVDPEGGFDRMARSAIEELANVMASGLLDGWANVLDTAIDHTPPAFIHDLGPAAVDPVVIDLGETQDFAFVFDTRVIAADHVFDCDIYAIPNERDLERALADLDTDRVGGGAATAEFGEVSGP